jgi:geranylgeranyl reductase family protein
VIDVAVVGGGPAGLLAAAHLAQVGFDVRVLEEHRTVGQPTHCTGIVSLETAEYAKVSEDLILSRLRRARLVTARGLRAEIEWEGSEEILAMDRAGFDAGLAAQAVEAGATLETGVRVDGVSVRPDRVEVSAGDRRIAARACVLACGVSYRFQRLLGLGMPGQVIHTAQLEVEAAPEDAVEMRFGHAVAPEGFVWTVPVTRDGRSRLKVGAMARGDAAGCLERFLARPDTRARLLAEPGRPIRRLLPLRPIAKTFADRVLVVGDAGGFTKPTTGGGIFYSLITASLAAETLTEGFHAGRLDEAFLARYERRWQDRLGQELRVAEWLRGLVTKCTDDEIDRLVGALGGEDARAVIRRAGRFNWHRAVILGLTRQPGIAALLFRTLFR